MRVLGLFIAAAAAGPMLCFGAILGVSAKMKLKSTDIVPLWYWAIAVAILIAGLALALWPRREDKDGTEEA